MTALHRNLGGRAWPPAIPRRTHSRARTDLGTAFTEDELLHRLHWAALVDAGLIGNLPTTPAHVAAIRDANDALFRSFRRRPRGG